MIRPAVIALAVWLSACAEPPPIQVDGDIVTRAVQLAQARADKHAAAAQRPVAEEPGKWAR